MAVLLTIFVLLVIYSLKDEIRTLSSLQRLDGVNAYVMDYYGDYHLDEIRTNGMDVDRPYDALIETLFSGPIEYLIQQMKSAYLPRRLNVISGEHHCTSAVYKNSQGETLFGRNFDWSNDACLILRIHYQGKVQSIAVLDLAYLNLNRSDLEEASFVELIPLLFAPYYLMDGMNEHGVAISSMSLEDSVAPNQPGRPEVLLSIAMRLVLEYAETTAEAIELLKQYNIRFAETSCHIMIVDADGDAAVVEFLGGQIKVTRRDEAWHVCTNHRLWGTTEEESDQACNRYQQASDSLAEFNSKAGSKQMMDLMASVAVENWTMWTTTYNLSTGEFRFAHKMQYENAYSDQIK